MPFALRLDDARSSVVNLASIDGKNGANGRHSPTSINLDLNREYRNLRTRVCQLGYPQFLTTTSGTLTGTPATNEDFQEVALPAASAEVIGVDVQNGGRWRSLEKIEFAQRRSFEMIGSQLIFPDRLLQSSDAIGAWTLRKAPKPNGASIDAGALAVWPANLTGPYEIHSVEVWSDITTDAHVFMLYEGWDSWLLNKTAMVICQRDGAKKRSQYLAAREAWAYADQLVAAGAPRLERQGYAIPTSYQGVVL